MSLKTNSAIWKIFISYLRFKNSIKISNFLLTTYFTTTYLRSFCRRQQWAHNETYFAWVPCTVCNPNFYGYLLVAVRIWAHLINKVMAMGVCFKYFEPFFNPFFWKKLLLYPHLMKMNYAQFITCVVTYLVLD